MKQLFLFLFFWFGTYSFLSAQNVGVGTTTPSYKFQVNDGPIALFNTTDVKTWYFNYSSAGNYFLLSESGSTRLVVANGGNVGIGTTSPAYKLDVNGTTNVETNLTVGGTATVGGNLTVNGGRGILYNLSGAQAIKYYTRDAAFNITNLGPHQLSSEGSVGFSNGFTAPPVVHVGDITAISGNGLYQMQLIIYDVTATNCKCRLLNTSNSTITQSCSWNIVCMGY